MEVAGSSGGGQETGGRPEDPFPAADFDRWALDYDADASAGQGFPFEGYERVLETVVEQAQPLPGQRVLDLGIGTGSLAALFAARGCQVVGVDFSSAMLARAAERLPDASLIQADLRTEWPLPVEAAFDRIVSAYTFHHFELELILQLLARAARHLLPGGRIVIADIAFADPAGLEQARRTVPDWEDEHFWIASEALPALRAAGFEEQFMPVPPWAGVFTILPGGQP